MALGPIDREMANPPESLGPLGHRRSGLREGIARTDAVPPMGDAMQEEKQDASEYPWQDHQAHDEQSAIFEPVHIDTLA